MPHQTQIAHSRISLQSLCHPTICSLFVSHARYLNLANSNTTLSDSVNKSCTSYSDIHHRRANLWDYNSSMRSLEWAGLMIVTVGLLASHRGMSLAWSRKQSHSEEAWKNAGSVKWVLIPTFAIYPRSENVNVFPYDEVRIDTGTWRKDV